MDQLKPNRYWLRRGVLTAGCAMGMSWAQATESANQFVTQLEFDSVIGQYQAHKDQKVAPWRETNDTVEKIGGWQVYAREAQMPDPVVDKSDAMAEQPAMGTEQGKKP